jgi:hypothetical protein
MDLDRNLNVNVFLMSASAAFLNVKLLSWYQQRVGRAILGRVVSVLMFASVGLIPLSLVVAGVVVEWSLRGMFAGAGVLVLIVTLLIARHQPERVSSRKDVGDCGWHSSRLWWPSGSRRPHVGSSAKGT